MAEDTNDMNHPWNTLETITTFDQGNNTMPTLRLDNIRENQDNRQVVQVTPSTTMLIISFIQQLCSMIEEDKVRRKQLYDVICDKMHELKLIDKSYNMLEFKTLRKQYQRDLYHLVMVARAATGNENILHGPRYLTSEFSPYLSQFQEIEFIAGGGFGQVFKALHRLDGIEYAIKKIVVLSSRLKSITRYVEEVKTLAKLNHMNIVQYKAAWIEPSLPLSFVSNVSSTSTEETSHRSCTSECTKDSRSDLQSNEHLFNNISESNSNKTKDNSKQDILFEDKINYTSKTSTKFSKQVTKMNGSAAKNDSINEKFHKPNSLTNITEKQINITQKSAEEKINLTKESTEKNSHIVSFRNSKSNKTEYVIEKRINVTQESTEENSHIVSFRNSKSSKTENQVKSSNATDYNDSHKTSNHREVYKYVSKSASNEKQQYMTLYIQMALYEQTLKQWMSERTSVTPLPVIRVVFEQIVCGLDYIHSKGITHHDIKPSNIFITTTGLLQIHLGDFGLACSLHKRNHHSVVGTQMYAAPEQLQGKCDTKSDIYSTGIVLIELLTLTQTQMELICIINSLKQGIIPQDISTERRKWALLIIQLIEKDPIKRPCAKQLLQDLYKEKDVTIADLKSDLLDRDNTIQELQNEVALLKEKVRKMEVLKSNKLLC